MKKLLLTLAALAVLTACSSTKDVKDSEIDANLSNTNEIALEETVETTEAPAPEIMPEIVHPIEEVNEIVTLYDKDGLKIISEEGISTIIMPSNVLFDFDKYSVNEEFKPLLNLLGDALMSNDDLDVTISGHTDNIGDEEYNNTLSLKRAQAARDYLVDLGVEEDRITTEGYGFTRPVDTNDTEAGRNTNRRIEVILTK